MGWNAKQWCLVSGLVTGCVVGACKDNATPPVEKAAGPAALQGGVQVVNVRVTDDGYVPSSVELKAGVPAKMVFKQESSSPCGAVVHSPDMGVRKTDLPLGKETAIEFTPKEAGTFHWRCGMDMMKGAIVVKG